jgi:hypothetical protein
VNRSWGRCVEGTSADFGAAHVGKNEYCSRHAGDKGNGG